MLQLLNNLEMAKFLLITLAAVAAIFALASAAPKATVTVQATNNTKVPSVTYIVDAVESLVEAFSIYADETQSAELYAALFAEKHPGLWNVAVGYTAFYIEADVYVETLVSNPKKDSSSSKLFLIFLADAPASTTNLPTTPEVDTTATTVETIPTTIEPTNASTTAVTTIENEPTTTEPANTSITTPTSIETEPTTTEPTIASTTTDTTTSTTTDVTTSTTTDATSNIINTIQ